MPHEDFHSCRTSIYGSGHPLLGKHLKISNFANPVEIDKMVLNLHFVLAGKMVSWISGLYEEKQNRCNYIGLL